jgi:hypothetical protein
VPGAPAMASISVRNGNSVCGVGTDGIAYCPASPAGRVPGQP